MEKADFVSFVRISVLSIKKIINDNIIKHRKKWIL